MADNYNDDETKIVITDSRNEPTEAETAQKECSEWLKWIDRAEKAAKDRHWKCASDATREYLHESGPPVLSASQTQLESQRPLPLFWSMVQVLRVALYSKTPVSQAQVANGVNSDVCRVAAIMLERLGQSIIGLSCFDDAHKESAVQLLLADKATNRVLYKHEEGTELVDREVVLDEAQGLYFFTDDGQAVPAELTELIQQTETGFSVQVEQELVTAHTVTTHAVIYDDIIHTPRARTWDQIQDIAFRELLTRDEVKELFGEELANRLAYSQTASKEDKANSDQAEDSQEQVVEIWEIWHKKKRELIWVCKSYSEKVLKKAPDPYGLIGFFPVPPFLMNTKPPKSMYPVPMYEQLRALTGQVHDSCRRIIKLMNGIRRRGLTDGSTTVVADAINRADDLEIVAVPNLGSMVKDTNLEKMIYWVPVQELVAAITELGNLIELFKGFIFELIGIPDLMRGFSNPDDGVQTQQLKGHYADLRNTNLMKDMQMLARNTLEIMCDLALKKFPDQYLAELMALDTFDSEQQPLIPKAFALLKNDRARAVKIDLETDSTSHMRQEASERNRNQVAQTLISGLSTAIPMIKENPQLFALMTKVLLSSLNGNNLGKQFSEDLNVAMLQIQDAMNQPPPEGPPPIDYEMLKLEIKQAELQLKAQKQQMDHMRQMMQVEIEAQDSRAAERFQELRLQLDQSIAAFDAYAVQQELKIEEFRVILSEREKMIEENRLAIDANKDLMNPDHGPRAPEVPAPTAVIINNPAPPAPPPQEEPPTIIEVI